MLVDENALMRGYFASSATTRHGGLEWKAHLDVGCAEAIAGEPLALAELGSRSEREVARQLRRHEHAGELVGDLVRDGLHEERHLRLASGGR